jgi:hypothetical protein
MSETTIAPSFSIRSVRTQKDLEAVQRVRKEVYVDELGFRITGTLADTGIFADANAQGEILIAYDGERPAGTVALGWWKDLDVNHPGIRHFQLRDFADAFSSAAITIISKWLVRQQYRGSRLALELAKSVLGFLQDHEEIEFIFIDSSPYLVQHYELLGFRHYAPPFQYDEGGILSVPMCLIIGDFSYLKSIRSPILPLLMRMGRADRPGVREYFETRWAPVRYGAGINLQDPTSYYPLTETEVIPEHRISSLFEGLSDSQVQLFCNHANERSFAAREIILNAGDRRGELLLLIEGYAEVSRAVEGQRLNIATLGPGDLVGEYDFLLQATASMDVRALTACETLVFPTQLIRILLQESPIFAVTLYRNLSRILARRLRASSLWITEAPPL